MGRIAIPFGMRSFYRSAKYHLRCWFPTAWRYCLEIIEKLSKCNQQEYNSVSLMNASQHYFYCTYPREALFKSVSFRKMCFNLLQKEKSISKIVAFILSTFFLCSFFLKRIFNRKQRKRKSRKETERDAMEWKKKEKKEKLPTGTNVYKNIHNYKYANECWINKHLIKSIYWKWDWSTFVFYIKNLKI